MLVFWKEGYEAASVETLCHATGLPRASLYKAYGGKQGLFLAAVQHYAETRMGPVLAALDGGGSLIADLAGFFDEVVALGTGSHGPNGCLVSCVLSDAAGTNPKFKAELEARFAALETRLAERIRSNRRSPDTDTSPEAQALLLAAVARGIMVRARAGTSAGQLAPIAQSALRYLSPHL